MPQPQPQPDMPQLRRSCAESLVAYVGSTQFLRRPGFILGLFFSLSFSSYQTKFNPHFEIVPVRDTVRCLRTFRDKQRGREVPSGAPHDQTCTEVVVASVAFPELIALRQRRGISAKPVWAGRRSGSSAPDRLRQSRCDVSRRRQELTSNR